MTVTLQESNILLGQKIFDEIVEIISNYCHEVRSLVSTKDSKVLSKILSEGEIELDSLRILRDSLNTFDDIGVSRITKIKEYLVQSLNYSINDELLRLEWIYKSSKTVYDRLRSRRVVLLDHKVDQDETWSDGLQSELRKYAEPLCSAYFLIL